MAYASSFQKAQIPVGCQLCEEGSKIQWKCCDCDVLMCTRCKEKVHSKLKNGNNHRIINLKEGLPQDSEETINLSDINCQQHADQPCCLFCKTCKELICYKCITQRHNGHNLVDEDEYDIKREKISVKKIRIENNLNHLTKMKEEKRKLQKSEISKYDKSRQDILAQKRIVEKLVQELLNELEDKWKKVDQDLEEKQNKIKKIEEKLHEQNTIVDKLVKWKDFVPFFNETDKLERLQCDDVHINNKYSSMLKFYPGKLTRDNIGTLKIVDTIEEQEIKIEIKTVREFTSDLQNIYYTAVCSDGSLWIGDRESKLIQLIQINGNNIEELLILSTRVLGMTVTPGDELLICNYMSTLKQVSRTGEMKNSLFNVEPLLPVAVHVTSSNTVIIGATTPGPIFPAAGRRVVIMMDQKGKFLEEYELDSNKEPLFTFPRRITSTSESNICVIDMFDSDYRGRVVVLSSTGDVINTYSGHCDINNETPFSPRGIITTTLNNIVVVDQDTHTIHILDSEGNFITYYCTKDLGIMLPCSVAVSTTTGNLFLGCYTAKESQDILTSKLYEVELSGF